MSARPLTRDANAPVVMVAAATDLAVDECIRYGLSEQLRLDDFGWGVGVYVATTLDEAHTLSLMFAELSWCVVPDGNPSEAARMFMRQVYGEPVTIATALNMQNNEYAIDPRALRRAGA